jgi:hypothetical protein
MNVAIGSAFRNCGPNVMRYVERVASLRNSRFTIADQVRIIAAEGDSTDDTRGLLAYAARYHGVPLDFVECAHGGPEFGSTEAPERMQALSKVCNAIFDDVRPEDDALFYVESDLLWDYNTAKTLISRAFHRDAGFDVFVPMVMAGPAFYDIWGFRTLDGTRFSSLPPFAPGLSDGLYEIGSAGSCLAMRGEVARACRVRNDYCLVGWCEDARARGYRLALCPHLSVKQL